MATGQLSWWMEASRTWPQFDSWSGEIDWPRRCLTYWKDFNNVWILKKIFSFLAFATWNELSPRDLNFLKPQCTSKFNSISRFAVVCIFIAQKFYSDFRYEVEDFSISSGVTIKDILKLETVTLEFLEYNLILSERDYYGIMLFGKIWIWFQTHIWEIR